MKITFIFVGNLKEKYLKEAYNDYLKRLKHYTKVEIIEIKEINEGAISDIINKESELILNKLNEQSYNILLDLKGKQLTSEELAKKIEDIKTYKNSNITFITGGSNGVNDKVKNKVDYKLSLSKLTFPHQLFRIFLLEQIYRTFKINNNEKYHK